MKNNKKYLICSCAFFASSVVAFILDEDILAASGIEKGSLIIGLCIAGFFFLMEGLDLDKIFMASSNSIEYNRKIQLQDERHITIENYSKAETYEMLSRLMIMSIFVLIVLEEISKVAVCIWVAIILGCEVGRFLYKKRLERKM
ncbi:hypothetical protein ACTNES_19465 [Blautia sp. HCP3S3_D9]|uniref:hypothetical protein n=1 Tax=Blautia sp. HCP3S3_D9 TaxID=3438912 RepID=UPI003F8BB570